MIQLKIDNHLIIPFGVPKWDISKIKIAGVSTQATYFASETPCAYVDKKAEKAIRIRHIAQHFPQKFPMNEEYEDDSFKAFDYIYNHIKRYCEIGTESERLFLDYYFGFCRKRVQPYSWELERFTTQAQRKERLSAPRNDDNWIFDAVLPLPQAHLYLHDPLRETYSFFPDNMFKVDFAFWTGKKVVAVEIDGASHIGNREHVRKDRLMQRAGVHVVHILNDELREYGERTISALLPPEITCFWCRNPHERRENPLGMPF